MFPFSVDAILKGLCLSEKHITIVVSLCKNCENHGSVPYTLKNDLFFFFQKGRLNSSRKVFSTTGVMNKSEEKIFPDQSNFPFEVYPYKVRCRYS